MGHGRLYDILAHVVFGSRRNRVFARLAALSGTRPGDHVLDVGCGTGVLTRAVARCAAPGGSAIGVDPSEGALARARRTTRLDNCTFQVDRAEALALPDTDYDVVVSSLMIHHLADQDRARALAEMFRVLRPGGRVLVAEFRPPGNAIVRRLIRPVVSPAMETNPIHLLEPMLTAAGFDHVTSGDLRPWIRFVGAVKPETTGS
ncbi:MAG: class I SAM-dependent methyltransferase [Acidimicrobiales bacterium]